MNIVLLLAHSIEEFDQVKLLSELGYNVFSIGAYSTPANPTVNMRPALPDVKEYPGLIAACHAKRVGHAEAKDEVLHTKDGPRNPVDWAKADLPEEVLDWADVIICHHLEHTWLIPQWGRIKHKRVIWRTVGQSVENNERVMKPLREEGLEIVRYSPKEENIPGYLGADAVIRFGKYSDDWHGWTGDVGRVINITQNLFQREPYTNWAFWDEATDGLPRLAIGPGSEAIRGLGAVSFDSMKQVLRSDRAYLYTGTQPASYTLGLIEALMTGIPVVSIGPSWMNIFPYGPELFEGHEIVGDLWSDKPTEAHGMLSRLLTDIDFARQYSRTQRQLAIDMFGAENVKNDWMDFLGAS